MLRAALIAAALMLLPPAAQAGEAAPQPVGQYVELQPVGLPVVVGGRLVNYVFVYVRVNLAPNADVSQIRSKEPFFRDALVRLAHRSPFVVPGDYNRIDQAKVAAAMLQAATAIAGPGVVRSVAVTSQAPQHRIANPKS